MEDYRFSTAVPLSTNEDTMAEFLDNDIHFCERFNKDAAVVVNDGTYAEIQDADGKRYAVHAGGDGDFLNHRIRFELL